MYHTRDKLPDPPFGSQASLCERKDGIEGARPFPGEHGLDLKKRILDMGVVYSCEDEELNRPMRVLTNGLTLFTLCQHQYLTGYIRNTSWTILYFAPDYHCVLEVFCRPNEELPSVGYSKARYFFDGIGRKENLENLEKRIRELFP